MEPGDAHREPAPPDDGAGGPPWLPTLGEWFVAAAVLLALPRMWIPAGTSLAVGLLLVGLGRRRAARAPREGVRAEPKSS